MNFPQVRDLNHPPFPQFEIGITVAPCPQILYSAHILQVNETLPVSQRGQKAPEYRSNCVCRSRSPGQRALSLISMLFKGFSLVGCPPDDTHTSLPQQANEATI